MHNLRRDQDGKFEVEAENHDPGVPDEARGRALRAAEVRVGLPAEHPFGQTWP